jgi:hypothetical protein
MISSTFIPSRFLELSTNYQDKPIHVCTLLFCGYIRVGFHLDPIPIFIHFSQRNLGLWICISISKAFSLIETSLRQEEAILHTLAISLKMGPESITFFTRTIALTEISDGTKPADCEILAQPTGE